MSLPEFEQTAWHQLRDRTRAAKIERANIPPADLVVNSASSLLATWWGQRRGGNWYWRCEVPARHLPGDVLTLQTHDLQMVDGQVTMPRQKGPAAVWQFPGNAARGILMRAQQVAGVKVVVEVDDNYLIQSPQVPNQSINWTKRIDKDGRHSHEAHARLARMADAVIVTTETLAESYRQVNGNVHVCRNSVDANDWDEPEKPDDGVFRIGYAASHSHWWDIADARRALSWASQQPGVEVVLYGLDPGWGFDYRTVPWTKDLAEYRRSLQQLDVGLCPLREGPWADCKSDIKLMEYAMAGACAIVQEAPPYEEWVETNRALTACDPKDFLKHVRWLVQNQDAAAEIAARAKAKIMETRLIQHEIHKWRAACA